MKVQRTHGPDNKTIICNVPPPLPGTFLSSPPELTLENQIESDGYGQFRLSTFMARYMAGNRSIREARKVSRKRLALVGADVGYMDPEACELHSQINRFIQTLTLLRSTNNLTCETVLKANKLLATESRESGTIRVKQNWIGSKDPLSARYVCPPPDMVGDLFDNWLEFVNDDSVAPIYRAIIGHCQLASVHPFIEGNGRLARVLLHSIIYKALGEHIPLLLYRLSPMCHPEAYVQMQELFNEGDAAGLSNSFWQNACEWNLRLQPIIKSILDDTKKQLSSKIGLCVLKPASARLIDYLWGQPIVSATALQKLFNQDNSQIKDAIAQLSMLGIIEARMLKEPKNAVIYDCPIIFGAYHGMDEAVFACK